jgi:hypothetical protein
LRREARSNVPAIAGRCIDVTFVRTRAAPAVASDGEPWQFGLRRRAIANLGRRVDLDGDDSDTLTIRACHIPAH